MLNKGVSCSDVTLETYRRGCGAIYVGKNFVGTECIF